MKPWFVERFFRHKKQGFLELQTVPETIVSGRTDGPARPANPMVSVLRKPLLEPCDFGNGFCAPETKASAAVRGVPILYLIIWL
jgi:hypothetical protein